MKVCKHTTVERIDAPTWDIIKDQIEEGLEKIAIDRRAAIEIGVPKETIDEHISKCGEITFRKFERMSNLEMKLFLLAKIADAVDNPDILRELLDDESEEEDGEEDN